MKNVFFRIVLVAMFGVVFINSSYSQKGYTLSVENRILNGVDSTVFALEVDRAFDKDVSKAWKKVVENKGKVKAATKNGLTSILGIIIERIDENPLDIYSSVIQQDTSVKLYVIFIVEGERVNPNGVEGASVKVRKLLDEFGAQIYEEVLERELEEKEDKLESLIKQRDKNLKNQDDLNKSIQGDSLKIASEETEIGLLKGQLEGSIDRYKVQKNKIAASNLSKDQAKEEKSKLKEIEKERKGIEKDIEKHSKEILDLKSEIREDWYSLKQLVIELDKLESDIVNQRKSVQEANDELENN